MTCRVLQVFSNLGLGGAETWLLALLKYFKESRSERLSVQFDICITGGERSVLDDDAANLGANLFYLRYSRKTLVPFLRAYAAILRRGYDAVHDHSDISAGFRYLVPRTVLPPVRIAHVHNPFYMLGAYTSSPLRRLTLRAGRILLAQRATHILGTSRQILDEYGFRPGTLKRVRTEVVHCGFDVTRFRGDHAPVHAELCSEFGFEQNAKILLFVGHLDRTTGAINQKNPEFALALAKKCIAEGKNVKLIAAGGGREKFAGLLKEWGVEQEIRLLGPRRDIPRLMVGSDLLLFPSIQEGLGMVAVEAQAAGLPVLASNAVPTECVVVPQLVEFLPLSEVAMWAERIMAVLQNPRLDGNRANALVRRSQFSIENSAEALLACYLPADRNTATAVDN